MEDRLNDAAKIVEDMEKVSQLNRIEEMIRDNKISFEHNNKQYRVRLLTFKEKEELDLLRRKKFGQLIKDKDILLEKDLIIQYKERGIDINELDENINKNESEDTALQLKLGESAAKNEPESILKALEEQIKTLRVKKQVLKTQKNLLLAFCLENQLENYVAEIITYLSLDELKDGVWQRMFKDFEDFQNYNDEELFNKAGSYTMLLQYL